MEFRILGPLEVRAADRPVPVRGAKPRAVLAVLLLHANRAVSADQLALALWGEEAPAGAANTIQVHVSRLRKALGNTEDVVTTPTGYRLALDPDQLDAQRFERLLADARGELTAGHAEAAASTLSQALALWRGRPLEDLAYEPFAQPEIARLEEARMAAFELLFEAKLALGAHAEVVGELEALIADNPYREGLRAQLMLALYRCDRQADALQAYQHARGTLVDELGIEPGERLRDLERAILAQDPALAPPAVADVPMELPQADAAPAGRRLVSVVFAGSTGLAERVDAESMHSALESYSAVIQRHGGTVEGFIGDALVGVFGKGELHEDDSVRAVRAAIELRDEAGMTLGVEAGEVFVGATFAAGGVFNVAARLQGLAGDREILLGEQLYGLVRHAVRAEPLGRAWRLLDLDSDDSRPPSSPFVNRSRELDSLRSVFARTRDERSCRAVTVIGPAGMGKSRLAREFIAEVEPDARVVVGRCPSYGEGVTYRPLAEIVGQLGGSDPRQRIHELLEDETVVQMVLGAIGLSDVPVQAEETFWAVRRMFERLAGSRPLVVVVEDIHWAEATLLDLLDYLLAFVGGQPVLLLCLTRPDLAEARPAWVAPQPHRSLVVLDALPAAEAHQLVAGAGDVGAATAERIVETAEGNPLFLEQLVAVGSESGEAALPSSIQAVLAARIARLEPAERALLEQASVQGPSFYVGALDDGARAPTRLVALVQKQLIRPERSELPGEDAFRFAHVLIREAAYRGLPKQRRAELHERVARWIERWPGAEDEIVGHHLGEAYRYRAELGPVGEREYALAGEAAERLAAAADAALLRGDPTAGARLLERAASLLEWYSAARGEVLPALGAALLEAGMTADAARVLDDAIASASEPRLRARAQVERELVRLETETSAGTDQARRVTDAAQPVLEADGDEYGLCRLWFLRGRIAWEQGRVGRAEAAWSEAAENARRAGAQRELFELVGWRALGAVLGPAPVEQAIPRCEAFRELVRASPLATASTLNPLAVLHAMKGELETADALLAEAGAILSELGGVTAGVSHLEAFATLLAGEPARAEASLRAHVELATEGSALATTTALLAHAVLAQGRADEAKELCGLAEQGAAADDMLTQVLWRVAAARMLARDGRCGEAESVAREAVARADASDLLWHHGDAMLGLAEVLRICGRTDEAERATRAGLALYHRKGILVSPPQGGT